jgi:transposase
MSMGKRKRDRQPTMWVTMTQLPTAGSHPFYRHLNELLREHGFDHFAEAQCAAFYAETMGRPGLPQGIYFRLLLDGGEPEGGHRSDKAAVPHTRRERGHASCDAERA